MGEGLNLAALWSEPEYKVCGTADGVFAGLSGEALAAGAGGPRAGRRAPGGGRDDDPCAPGGAGAGVTSTEMAAHAAYGDLDRGAVP
jgi:hypothetical protein